MCLTLTSPLDLRYIYIYLNINNISRIWFAGSLVGEMAFAFAGLSAAKVGLEFLTSRCDYWGDFM